MLGCSRESWASSQLQVTSPSVHAAASGFLSRISSAASESIVFVIACSKAKSARLAKARDLYRSGRFQVQRRIAEGLSRNVFVLSAKHGILDLEEKIEPYDVTFPNGIFAEGAEVPQLNRLKGRGRNTIVFFGGNRYLEVLRRSLGRTKLEVIAPFEHLNSYATALWCRIVEDVLVRRTTGAELYGMIAEASRRHGVHRFELFGSLREMPQRGVYYFFDPDEETKFSSELPRIVRVGTHAVSAGSRSTLRTRLRAHFGQRDTTGNHRASIFRLHVGNALLARSSRQASYPSWGKGMSADRATKDEERALEVEVSRYLSRLLFSFVELSDASSPTSQRSQLERASINFLGADGIPLESPSQGWLGLSARPEIIRSTGLWNIQHNGERFVRRDLDIIARSLFSPMMEDT
jgi:hypothetical protein